MPWLELDSLNGTTGHIWSVCGWQHLDAEKKWWAKFLELGIHLNHLLHNPYLELEQSMNVNRKNFTVAFQPSDHLQRSRQMQKEGDNHLLARM